ncbi:ice-binding family protein [Aequorivita antarctica]|uniref:DUF3494 domain-containing protein n=1 Tax=Aequorivita antarctica TaxID=153266 RepID=A0A5C6Z3B3_9FLAO|nr:ice-binding family protein [Aequorivita antarctica]TXD74355.1 DUF3494 domain-containing protein [Aequorivita antarctica]SRX73707.1 hypothetical protein AEQU3_01139 [Aequorivita antarctica]
MKIKNVLPAFALALVTLFTACSEDETTETNIPPTINSTHPASNAIEVPRNQVITIEFNEAMDPTTINATSFSLTDGDNSITGDVSFSGTTASFTPTANLNPLSNYTAMLTTDAKDLGGKAIETEQVWSFTTGTSTEADVIAPTVLSTDPEANEIDVARNKVISVNFSEAMDSSTINASTFSVKQADLQLEGTVSYSGTTAKFISETLLGPDTSYTVTIATGVTDVAGNALEANTELSFTTRASEPGLGIVDLGDAGNYVILAKTAINNVPTSAVTGNLGLSPAATSYITGLALTDYTGYATSAQVTGKIYAADMAAPTPIKLTTAVENMITAYNDAAGRPTPDFVELGAGNIGGLTLTTGLYKWTNTVIMPTDVTISGTADDVWIFQIAGDLNMSSAVNITLEGGAKASNIFWQVGGEATLGTTAHFEGVILSMTGITLQTGASLNGRALAQTAVILDGNTVVQPQ